MALKLYVDRMSQPSRAVIIFCKLNGIDFEEVRINLSKREQLSPEFKEINPMKQVPAIMDGRFKLSESHAILKYLACAFPGIADHWYPADLYKRAKVDSVLDWHHSNLRPGAAAYVFSTVLAPSFGLTLNPQAAAEAEKVLLTSLAKIESVWLQKKGQFLLGSGQPSIADLSLVCELMQLEVLDEKDCERIIGPYKRVLKWIDDTKNAMQPHFQEVHVILFKAKERFHKQRSAVGSSLPQSSRKPDLHSKM
ncbi:Glutathione S-transferase T1 [Capsicum baccatum]|uniref:glutathione transferase n=1 Tax=Capsicum baccatum TaxID=33114 RepID=A0A2G2XK94_CAPBA|nr:Glutathione S-transferase T1 [Capsicum baccatum]